MIPANSTGPTWESLVGLFPRLLQPPRHEIIPASDVPSPYYQLLVHDEHMTLTVEAHHGDFVDVEILESQLVGESYARMILLRLRRNRRPVQFGIVRVDLSFCSPTVRGAILEGKTPFGRILIANNVLRRIEPTAYLRVYPNVTTQSWFEDPVGRLTFGRLAYIHCDGKPAVELLEIVGPEDTQ